MKGFKGAALLTLAAGLAGLAQAKQPNKARLVENADLAAMPNMNMLQHGIQLTQRGPRGGWRAYGGFRHGGGGTSGSPTVNVGIAATVTADLNVQGTVSVQQTCPQDKTLCGPGFCTNLQDDVKNCGQCGFECPKYAYCDGGEFLCECPESFECQVGDECTKPVCGSCTPCPSDAQCINEECVCPNLFTLCTPENALSYCANINGLYFGTLDIAKRDAAVAEADGPGGDVFNCGKCGYTCPQADPLLELSAATCRPGPGVGAAIAFPAHCECDNSLDITVAWRICSADDDFGGGVCAAINNDYYCGEDCLDCTVEVGPASTCILTGTVYGCSA